MTAKLFESVLGIADPWFVASVEPDFSGRLNGFTLLFEAFILMLSGQMPFAAVSRIVGESAHRVLAVFKKYVEMACGLADHSNVTALAIDETRWTVLKDTARLKPELSYDRIVAECFLPDGRDLAAELVRSGLALDWRKFSGGKYRHLEPEDARRKLWRAQARQRGLLRM